MSNGIKFETVLDKFGQKGEKTGWTYILITPELANEINPGVKKSYRVNCRFDFELEIVLNVLPIGDGGFIIPFKRELQRKLRKKSGDKIKVEISIHETPYSLNQDFLEYLNSNQKAKECFNAMPISHQNYFSKWIDSAKTINTKADRIVRAVNALGKNWNYSQMIRNKA